MKITFEVPGNPQGKGRARAFRRGNFIGHYTPENTANYENLIKVCYIKAVEKLAQKMTEKPLKISITAVFDIPQSYSRTKAQQALEGQTKPSKKPDCDNIGKVVADALNQIAYPDDKNIVEMFIKKQYGKEPKLIIEIEEV